MKTITVVLVAAGLSLGAVPATADVRPAVSASHAAEQALDPAALAAAIAGLPNGEASGALLQVRGEDGCWQGTSGVANIQTGQKVPVNGRFRIGSMTKAFTPTAVLQLVAKGKLRLDRTVQSY